MAYRMLTTNMFLIGAIIFSVQFYGSADGITCLACTGVVQPRYCTNIRHCPHHDFCGVQKYKTTTGRDLFDVDCVTDDVCHRDTSNNTVFGLNLQYSTNGMLVTCGECCSSDLCNQQGCGEIGYPKERGLLCYNCKQVLDPGSCEKISVCRTDEMCAVIKQEMFGDVFYESRCLPKYDCLSSLSETFGRKKRQDLHVPCTTCCQSDMCNDYCGQDLKTTTVSTVSSSTLPYSDNGTYTYSTGNEFVFMFSSKYYTDTSLDEFENVMVVTREGDSVDVDVFLPSGLGNYTLSGDGLKEFNITKDAVMSENIIETKAVYVRSTEAVTVIAMNFEKQLSDTFLALPVTACSNDYLVTTIKPRYGRQDDTFVGIVSLYGNNIINITLKTSGQITFHSSSYRNGDTLSLTLQKHETFELAHDYDLTGTIITSSLPVCVTAGCRCATAMMSESPCSRFEEMMIPVKYFTNSFVVPSIYQWPGSIIRIVSSVDYNVVTWNTSGIIGKVTLGKRSYKDLEINNSMTYIESSGPVTVTQYAKQKEVHEGFMMLLPGLSQYKYDYDFAVYGNGFISYVTVIITSNYSNGLTLDGKSLSVIPGSRDTLHVRNDQYEVFSVAVSSGSHHMRHSSQIRFGLFVYGSLKNGNRNNGYGYPAGFQLI